MVKTVKIAAKLDFAIISDKIANNDKNRDKHQEIEGRQCNGIHLPYADGAFIQGLDGFFLVKKLSARDNKSKKGQERDK